MTGVLLLEDLRRMAGNTPKLESGIKLKSIFDLFHL